MNYKEMIVWSEGSEDAKSTKKSIAMSIIVIILDIILVAVCFIANPNDDMTIPVTLGEHILFGLFGTIFFGWLIPLLLFSIKNNLKAIKSNKLIPIRIYDIDEFIKIYELSDDEFVIFSDEYGAVLALKEYEKESKRFCDGTKYFYQFEEYYEKHTGYKREVSCNLAPIEKDNLCNFSRANVIIENRKNGVQPAIFIIENNRVYLVTVTPSYTFWVTDEGAVGERYDENGKWCGDNNEEEY